MLLSNHEKIMAENLISGYVLTDTDKPIEGCLVSDGFSVVKTDNTGAYSFQRNDSTEFVFISLPAAYEVPIDARGLPLLYMRVPTGKVDFNHNFTLKPYEDGGLADIDHIMIGISDPQVQNDYETWRFRNESIKDIQEHITSFPEKTRVYGVVVGDLVWDLYNRFEEHAEGLSQLGFPVFNVIGNHDHDRTIRQDWGADHYFKDAFGPTYYSFDRGKVHYIVLDNIEYTNATGDKSYRHNIVDYQMEWLKKDLEHVANDTYIVFLAHAPFEGSKVLNRETVYNLVASKRNTHSITGHHHRLTNYEIKNNFYDHTLGAVQGAFWSGDICTDGTPNGYGVFQASKTGFKSWYYKSTGYNKDYQMRVYPPNSFVEGQSLTDYVIVNIWNYDSKWSDVYIYENGEKYLMYQYSGVDPLAYDFLLSDGDTRPNYPGSDGGTLASRNPGASATSHMFSYKPKDPNANFIVEVTDRNGDIHRESVLKNLMVASFEEDGEKFAYKQNFNSIREFPNHFVSGTKTAKTTYVQGHTPIGWYACTSGLYAPGAIGQQWEQFNYYLIDNGSYETGGLMAYGEGNPNSAIANDSDRSLGSLVSGSHKNIHFGVLLENNTSSTFDGLEINYIGKLWRGGRTPTLSQTLSFSYAINPDIISLRKRTMSIAEIQTIPFAHLSFNSPITTNAIANSACNGNLPQNQTSVNGSLNVKLYPGDIILLRWEDVDDLGNDNGLAIDDLVVRPSATIGIEESKATNLSFYNIGTLIYFDRIPESFIEIYDLTGRYLSKVRVTDQIWDLSTYATKGVFFLKTEFGTKKIILN